MRILRAILVAAAAGLSALPALAQDPCAGHVPQARPQNASRDIVGQDLDQIAERGYMTFAVYADNPPYSWRENGQVLGVDADIARLIAQEIGVEARFDVVPAGETLEADLRNYIWQGPVMGGRVSNVMMRVPYDSAFACRVEQVVFTGQYAGEAIAIAYAQDAYPDAAPTPAFFRFGTVAVENDTIADFYLSSFAGGQMVANVRRFPTMAAAMEALGRGEVGAAMGPRSQIDRGLAPGMAVHEPPLAGFAISKWTVGVAVHFGYRDVSYAVDDAIAAGLADGTIARLHAEHGLTYREPIR